MLPAAGSSQAGGFRSDKAESSVSSPHSGQRPPALIPPLLASQRPIGCDSKEVTHVNSTTPTVPTPAPATQASDVIAPTTQPSQILIDGRAYSFPPARLRVSKTDGHVVARLYTN